MLWISGGFTITCGDQEPPLTPSLSPWARENRPPRCRQSRASRFVAARDAVSPLPAGEGQGEGERGAANQNGRTNSARSARPIPRVSGLCCPKTNFPTHSKQDRRQPPSALVFRALLPPHPGPLPWGEGESSAALSPIPDCCTVEMNS